MDRQTLTIIQHNVQTWTTKRHALTNIYNGLDPDVILLNETSIKDSDRLSIFNYNVYTTNRLNQQCSGAAIAIRKNIQARIDDDFFQDFLTATIETVHGPVTIATGYVPPRQPYINTIDLHRIFDRRHPVYFAGDLNAFHTTFGYRNNDFRGKQIVTLLNTDKCRHIGPYFDTRLTAKTMRKPDIVLTNRNAYFNTLLKPGPLTPSDHIPIHMTISTNPLQIPIRPRLQFAKTDWTIYKDILNDSHIPDLGQETLEDIDNHVKTFTDLIQNATKLTTPTITYRTVPGVQPTAHVKKLQDINKRLMTIMTTYGTNPERHRLLLTIRRNLKDEYQRLNTKTWNDIIDKIDAENDPKIFFKAIKRMTGNSTNYSPFIIHNDKKLFDPKDQEPIFRGFWSDIFKDEDPDENDFDYDFIADIETRLNDKHDQTIPYNNSDLTRLHNTDCPPITMTEMNDIIKSIKPRASGPNNLTAHQLKNLPGNMRLYLTDIFNHSLSAGYFPDSYKHATMTLIPKPGTSGTTIKDKRPISLLDVDGKLLDKILNRRLTTYLEENNLQNDRQHGFRRNRGTQTAILTLHETISRHLGLKHQVDIACRDVTKAFDKIWHTGLKYKLTELGLHDCYVRILCDYLDDRTASIKIGHYTGPPFNLETGVPQGACLSPTLFNIQVKDIPQPLPDTDYIQYADDITQIIALPGPPEAIAQNTAHAIRQINEYENRWKIQTNMTKFTIMNISRRRTVPIYIDDEHLDYSRTAKVLGLTYSNTGLTPQVTVRRAMAFKTLDRLQRFRHLSSHNKRRLYLTILRPQLLYPIIPLNTISDSSYRKLQQVQNKALRFIENTGLTDRIPSIVLHNRNNLPAVNTYLHRRAKDIWTKLQDNNPDIYDRLKPDRNDPPRNTRFPSTYLTELTPDPLPIYV